jgi:ribosomal protein S18 acetylase RimI-like enzyme
MIAVSVVTNDHDLLRLVEEINAASWDAANEMCAYDAEALSAYLDHQGTVFLACHWLDQDERTLLAIASARLEIKPYGMERWLYVDEVDVCADQRRQGAGRAILRKLMDIAEAAGCVEVWLGTELDNRPANALYRSLSPRDVEQFVGYTFDTKEAPPHAADT